MTQTSATKGGLPQVSSDTAPLMEARNLTKSYGSLSVLRDVNVTLQQGEVLALVGENGAGKSTLMKILSGVIPNSSYEGELFVKGNRVSFASVQEAESAGVVLVPQELHVIPHLTIAENMFAGHLPGRFGLYDEETAIRWARDALSLFKLKVDPRSRAAVLSPSERRLIVLAAALHRSARLLILDEPTAALTDTEADALIRQLAVIRHQGVGIIYITHRLDEIAKIADRVQVLRNGVSVASFDSIPPREQMVHAMLGDAMHSLREVAEEAPFEPSGQPILQLKEFSVFVDSARTRPRVHNIDLEIYPGEIVGLYGLVGAGRTELARALVGMWPGPASGQCVIDGREGRPKSVPEARARGLSLLVEDRKSQGVLHGQSVAWNMTVAMLGNLSQFRFLVDKQKEQDRVQDFIGKLGVRPARGDISINALSGGNQQKVLLGRCLIDGLRVLILDEPTLGVDIGARAEIYRLIRKIARDLRVGVLLISSDADEVRTESDRILVMYKSRIQKSFARGATTQQLLSAATGV